jgi:hypothetical protein
VGESRKHKYFQYPSLKGKIGFEEGGIMKEEGLGM